MEPVHKSRKENRSAPAARVSDHTAYSGVSVSPPVQDRSYPEQKPDSNHTVVQRAPGDEPYLNRLTMLAEQANLGFGLIVRQAHIADNQMQVLEGVLADDDFAGHPKVAPFVENLRESADAVRNEMAAEMDDARDKRNIVTARSDVATIEAPTDLLLNWTSEAGEQVAEIGLVQAKISAALTKMRDDSVNTAREAMSLGETDVMKRLLQVADTLDAALEDGDSTIEELNQLGSVGSSAKEKLSMATVVSDSLNNATTGLAFGVVGAFDAGTVFSLSATAGSVMGYIGGVLGILFGAIGTFLGVKNAILGGTKRSKLKKAKPKISNEEMEKITDYAINQKNKKLGRNIAGSVGGLVAISAGVIGLIAVIAGTMGIAAIVMGIVAGLIGLGFVGFKIIRNWWKRRKERKDFADELINQVTSNGEQSAAARTIIQDVGLNPDNAGQPKFRKKLIGKVGDYAKSKRTEMAEGIVRALIDGKPSESFDAEIILTALGVDPSNIRQKVTDGAVSEAVGQVAKKLASW